MTNEQAKRFDALMDEIAWKQLINRLYDRAELEFGRSDEVSVYLERALDAIERKIASLAGHR